MIIFFDLDGTLIDSTQPIITSLRKALESYNFNLSDEYIKTLIGMSTEGMFETIGVPKEQVADIVKLYRQNYKIYYKDGTSLLNGAKEAVKFASKNAKVGLVTTKSVYFAKEILKDFDILDDFSVVVGGDEVKYCKPNPEPIYKALSRLKGSEMLEINELKKEFDFSKIYMIGDTLNDTEAAKAAGVNAYVTLFEYTDMNTLKQSCDKIFTTPLECVQDILKK
ncbi:HAD-IA family hydrolase [Campylobacter sp. 2018MI13]|uniref:HAD family hydrolase n=1 Tax=Campylobacter sp. 2018MI13 TaxID=2836737 RepID=UPI001BDA2572|nr:HAD-IA family hydrolase [Campylobacter sp. 2018MI13]MBT0883399.1 HAD family hydrolase [Campylobacter sp. 2018MI13]